MVFVMVNHLPLLAVMCPVFLITGTHANTQIIRCDSVLIVIFIMLAKNPPALKSPNLGS